MLTPSQHKTYEFIKRFMTKHPYAPTAAEIAEGIGIRSRGVVHRHLQALTAAGKINMIPGKHRNIRLPHQKQGHSVPILGTIAAGQPIEAIQSQEYFDFDDLFDYPDCYILRVRGDSMIDEGIFENDMIICRQTSTANNGEIVVALIDEHEATLKRFYNNPDHTVTLVPANAMLKPMIYPAERVRVQGVFMGLVRWSHKY